MTLNSLAERLGLERLSGSLDKEVTGCYAGDLLSWVMSHAQYGDVWVTIMSNVNVIAVASLTECASVIMAEGVVPDEAIIKTAEEKDITIFTDSRSTFELCRLIGKELEGHD